MTDPPSYRKVNPADAPILILTLSSDIAPLQDMDAFAQQVISPALSTIDGVAQVQVFGSQKYAVRVQLDPDALAARGIGVDEVQAAIAAANANTPVGTLKNTKQSLTIQAQTELSNAEQFRNIIVATRNGKPVRLGDLACVTDSVENNQTASWYNGNARDPARRLPSAGSQHGRGRRPHQGAAAELRQPAAAAAQLQRAQRPLHLDPRRRARRAVHARADHRARHHGDLPVPAQSVAPPSSRRWPCRSR